MSLDRVIADIRRRGFSNVVEKWGVTPDGDERRQKYLDLERWIPANWRRIEKIGLHEGRVRRVLDLGCGCGYFLYLCKLLGHDVLGVDRAERSSLFVDVRELLEVPWVPATIRYGESLPSLGKFDVVAAHMVTFNGHKKTPWGPTEWEWLLSEIPAATWSIELNAEPDGTLFPKGLREWFIEQGAEVQGHRVLINR